MPREEGEKGGLVRCKGSVERAFAELTLDENAPVSLARWQLGSESGFGILFPSTVFLQARDIHESFPENAKGGCKPYCEFPSERTKT